MKMDVDLEEVKAEIAATKAEITQAKKDGDIGRRDRLETYLIKLQEEKRTYCSVKR